MTRSRPLADWEMFPHFALQITGRCNLQCPFCYRGTEEWDMPVEEALSLASAMRERGYSWVALGGGEPTLHPRLEELTEGLHRLGLKVSLTTNGTRRGVLCDLAFDGISVSASVPGWEDIASLRPDLDVCANIVVRRGEGEAALAAAVLAGRNGFARVVLLPLQRAAVEPAPVSADGYPDASDLDLVLLAEPWLEELGLEVAFGCAALRTMGLLDRCPDEFRTIDLHGRVGTCAFPACPHRAREAGGH